MMTFEFDLSDFVKDVSGDFEKVSVNIGVQNLPHKRALPKSKGLKTIGADRVARKIGNKNDGQTTSTIAQKLEDSYKVFSAPIEQGADNKDLKNVIGLVCQAVIQGDAEQRSIVNGCKAMIVVPLIKKDYGNNAPSTIKAKGFDSLGIDTAQFLNSIDANVEGLEG